MLLHPFFPLITYLCNISAVCGCRELLHGIGHLQPILSAAVQAALCLSCYRHFVLTAEDAPSLKKKQLKKKSPGIKMLLTQTSLLASEFLLLSSFMQLQ